MNEYGYDGELGRFGVTGFFGGLCTATSKSIGPGLCH